MSLEFRSNRNALSSDGDTPDTLAIAALNSLTTPCTSPIDEKSTASALGMAARSVMQVCMRFVSVRVEFTLPASVGSGGPSGRSQWLTMKNGLSVFPRLGAQLNWSTDVKVKGVSCDNVYVPGSHLAS